MSVLALDLGTNTGWCLDAGARLYGHWKLAPSRFDGGGMRYVRFRGNLDAIARGSGISAVAYEEVRSHKGVNAAHIYGGLMATLQAWCEDSAIPYKGIPVGTIKKFWCGNGNAGKPDMIAQAKQRGFPVADDDEADAIALWHYWMTEGVKS